MRAFMEKLKSTENLTKGGIDCRPFSWEDEMETVAAISTPNASGGIGMIRISGDEAISIAEKVFSAANGTKVSEMRGYTCAYGTVSDGEMTLDDVVLTVFRAPHSYTGEDIVEITCHGGVFLCRRILSLLFSVGATPAGAGEFTKRAYLNGKLALSQAEAVMDVISAEGETALRQANLVKSGRLSKRMRECSDDIANMLAAFAYWMDDAEEFPPELHEDTLISNIDSLRCRLQSMLQSYQNGKVFREGVRTVLLGLPNAGKSSVMNWLCGSKRSIVTDIAGTTRDVVTEQVRFGEYTLLLADTAGIREANNPIEAIGIESALQEVENADLILYVVDANYGISSEDLMILRKYDGHKLIVLWNKMDACEVEPPHLDFPVVSCSAKTFLGERELLLALQGLFPAPISQDNPSILNERQRILLEDAIQKLANAVDDLRAEMPLDMVYQDLEMAAESLRNLDGTSVSDDVVNQVFSRFCVGK